LEGKSGVANNPKVDSIVAPVAKEKEEQPVFSPQETEAPLFVPAEPEVPQIKAKKESIWFKDLVGEDKPKTPKPPKAPKVPKEPKVKAEKVPKAPKMKIHHKIAAWIVLAVFLFVTSLSLAGGAYAHQEIYKNKVFPGVVVWGENVGGKSTEEVQKIITDKIQNYKINLAGPDQNYTATADDLGLVFDSETIALSAFSKGRTSSFWDNYFTRARLMLAQVKWKYMQKAVRSTDLEIEPKFTVDDKKLDEYLAKVSDNIKIVPQDSKVTVESGNIKLVPAIYGREVEKSNLKEVLLAAIKDFRSSKINIQTNH
jgi:hypothetical protein